MGVATILDHEPSLASITLIGPDYVIVSGQANFAPRGVDPEGRAYTLATANVWFQAPSYPGPVDVCHTERGVTGCKRVTVLGHPLVAIRNDGPTTLAPGETVVYGLHGVARDGSAYLLATTELPYTAPSTPGPAQVRAAEAGIEATLDIMVEAPPAPVADPTPPERDPVMDEVPADAVAITYDVVGPAILETGGRAEYRLVARDEAGAIVREESFAFAAPDAAGLVDVCRAHENGIACFSVEVVAKPASQPAIAPSAEAPIERTSVEEPTPPAEDPQKMLPAPSAVAALAAAGLLYLCSRRRIP